MKDRQYIISLIVDTLRLNDKLDKCIGWKEYMLYQIDFRWLVNHQQHCTEELLPFLGFTILQRNISSRFCMETARQHVYSIRWVCHLLRHHRRLMSVWKREKEVVAQVIPPTIPELVRSADTTSWTFSSDQVVSVETLTQGKANNNEWIRQLLGRRTASNVNAILAIVRTSLGVLFP